MTSGSELAAMEGRKFGLDQAMTAVSFLLLLIIVAIPIFMIVYNAFFYEGKFDISLFVSVIGNVENLKAMWNTIVIALAVTVFGTIMGLFYAWLLGRSDIPAKGIYACHVYHSLYVSSIFRLLWPGIFCFQDVPDM